VPAKHHTKKPEKGVTKEGDGAKLESEEEKESVGPKRRKKFSRGVWGIQILAKNITTKR